MTGRRRSALRDRSRTTQGGAEIERRVTRQGPRRAGAPKHRARPRHWRRCSGRSNAKRRRPATTTRTPATSTPTTGEIVLVTDALAIGGCGHQEPARRRRQGGGREDEGRSTQPRRTCGIAVTTSRPSGAAAASRRAADLLVRLRGQEGERGDRQRHRRALLGQRHRRDDRVRRTGSTERSPTAVCRRSPGGAMDVELVGGKSYSGRIFTGGITSTTSIPVVGGRCRHGRLHELLPQRPDHRPVLWTHRDPASTARCARRRAASHR